MQQLNSHSKDESGIWETNMLAFGMVQYLARKSLACALPGSLLSHPCQQGRLMRKVMLREARRPTPGCTTLQDDTHAMRLQTFLPHSPGPARCESHPRVVPRPLASDSPALQLKAQMLGPNPGLVNHNTWEWSTWIWLQPAPQASLTHRDIGEPLV